MGIGCKRPNGVVDIIGLLVPKGRFPNPDCVKAEATKGLENPLFPKPELPTTLNDSLFGVDQFKVCLSSLLGLHEPKMGVDFVGFVLSLLGLDGPKIGIDVVGVV